MRVISFFLFFSSKSMSVYLILFTHRRRLMIPYYSTVLFYYTNWKYDILNYLCLIYLIAYTDLPMLQSTAYYE